MANNKLTIKVDADTTEALQQIKEVTEAANECVAALEKLETIMKRITSKSEHIKLFTEFDIALCGEVKASEIIQRINNAEEKVRI